MGKLPKLEVNFLEKTAVKAAVDGDWDKAIDINKKIIQQEPLSTGALNRLARAYWEKGQIQSAKTAYGKVLKIDKCNPIASKNLARLQSKTSRMEHIESAEEVGEMLLEEPGKTKIIKLVKLASPSVLASLHSADLVALVFKKHFVQIATPNKKVYLGTIPDDLSRRLIALTNAGNLYKAIIKSVDKQELEILIREVYRTPKLQNQPSFPRSTSDFVPNVILHDTVEEESEEEIKKEAVENQEESES